MDHRDHVGLLRPAVEPGGTWADIGAGEGAFTLALADLLGPGGRIVAVDRDGRALETNTFQMQSRFPATLLTTLIADFASDAPLPLDDVEVLDGLIAANSLHFLAPGRQVPVVRSLAAQLRPAGRFV